MTTIETGYWQNFMRSYLQAAAVILATMLIGLSGPAIAGDRGKDLSDGHDAFDIDLPKDCALTDKNGPDFEVFYIACGGKPYGGIYVGNAANPDMPRSRLIKTDFGWPAEIQVWSLDVPDDQARADAIAASVKVRSAK